MSCPFARKEKPAAARAAPARRLDVLAGQVAAKTELVKVGDESMFVDPATGANLFLPTMRAFHARVPRAVGVGTYGSFRPGKDGQVVESTVYLVTKPAHVKKIMDSTVEHYLWGGVRPASESFFGPQVLFCLEGEEWSELRQTMRPVLLPGHLSVFTDTIGHTGSAMLERIRAVGFDQPHDVLLAFQTYHLQAAARGFYSTDIHTVDAYPKKTDFHASFDVMLAELTRRSFAQDMDLMMDYDTPNKDNDLWNTNKQVIHDAVFDALQPRLEGAAPPEKDLLQELLESYKKHNASMDMDELMETLGANLVEMLFAGYNTVVNTLGNAVELLASNPRALEKLRAELDAVLGDRERPSHKDLEELPYLTNVFWETLRLRSPVAAVARRATDAVDLAPGLTIPLDAEVMFPVDALHYDPVSWQEPNAFLPERWDRPTEPCAWMPFSHGARRCLGQHYAKHFFAVGLAMFVRAFDFENAPGYKHMLQFTGFGSTPFCANKGVPTVQMLLRPRAGARAEAPRQKASSKAASRRPASRSARGGSASTPAR